MTSVLVLRSIYTIPNFCTIITFKIYVYDGKYWCSHYTTYASNYSVMNSKICNKERYKRYAIKKGCSTQSIVSLASDLLEILCSHREK